VSCATTNAGLASTTRALLVATSATLRIADVSVWLLLEALTEVREAASSKVVMTASTPALPL
jgi:hypothetical protein